jgi:UDP-N-acetylmuramyl pentapeptide phosphotransferase/UDP-N-acetylglucosamine-1-phosphate transferase
MYICIAAVMATGMIVSWLILRNIIKMLCNSDNKICCTPNYRGREIPAIGGIVFIPILLIAILLLVLSRPKESFIYLSYLVLVLGMGFAGVVDDLIGEKKTKGLINHIKSTMRGTVTTGFFKAFIGFSISFIISLGTSNSFIEFVINVLIISLFANTLNLFDLRPGRAVKVFIAVSLILLTAATGRLLEAVPLIILNLAACFYIRYDLNEICMLGDTGANILGVSLGYYSTLFVNVYAKLLLLVILLFLNIFAEKFSITEIINKSRLLSYLDSIGRRQTGNR